MAYPDLWRFLSGGLVRLGGRTHDRGWAIDRRWEVRRAVLDSMGTLLPPAPVPRRLGDWARDVVEGTRPAHIFNATVVESGAAFRMASVDLGTTSARLDPGSRPHELWDFYDDARADIEVATAARLSASFPWVSPMSRAWADPAVAGDVDSSVVNGDAAFRLADGGYFDNFGVFSAIEFLEDVGTDELKRLGIRRVLFVQIRATPEASAAPKKGGLHYSLVGPVMAMNNVRTSSQIARNDVEVELLRNLWAEDSVAVVPAVFDLCGAGPLSWHLSEPEKDSIVGGWSPLHERAVAAVLPVLRGEPTGATTPSGGCAQP
jgi:hypothetical protein